MNKIIARTGIFILLGGFMVLSMFSSCRKEAPTIAVITVVDSVSNPFPGAMVRLYVTPTISQHGAIIIDDTLYSDIDGQATFDFTDMYNLGQAGFAVLDIEVRSGDTLYGEGIIKVVDEETSEETVILDDI